MKNIYKKFALAALFIATIGSANAQQCLTGGCSVTMSQWPTTTQSISSASFTPIATNLYAGDYSVCNVIAGVTYEWSLCAADGGSASYDSELTLMNGTTNAILCYSDDACGDDAKIGWTATYTGTVKIQINQYVLPTGCGTNSTNTTLVWRTVPTGTDASVANIYTLGSISTANSNPHAISARVTNMGTTTFTNLPVTLTVSGANSYTNVQTIPSLATGASAVVTFPGFTSTATGTNNITVTIPTDDIAANNTNTESQTVTTNTIGYSFGTTVTGGAGFNTGTGEVASKFYTSSTATVNQVKVYFTAAGTNYKLIIRNAAGAGGTPGAALYTSANQTSVLGLNTVNITPPVSVSNNFYIGVEQVTANTNMGLGYQAEDVLRSQTFYYNVNAAAPAWTDLSPAAPFRVMVDAVMGCTAPGTPAAISGPAAVCGATPVTYSVAAVTGATGYNWTLPAGWSGTSTTNSITVTPGAIGGSVSVTAANACTTSTAQTLAVTVTPGPPAQPAAITGSASACSGSATTYSVAPVAGASTYNWTLPSGWTGTSTSNSISATAGASGGNISVTASNGCGTSTAQTFAVTVSSSPATPGAITGNASVCGGSANTYSVPAVAGATSYNWTLPGGWTGSSTSNSINVTAGTGGGTISVTANNTCGASTASTMAIGLTNVPAQPTIFGQNSVCQGASVTYTTPAVTGATSYNWTLPTGWTGASTTNTIVVTTGTTGGNVSVSVTNSCGTSTVQNFAVTATAGAPAQPGAITGDLTVCAGGNATLSVPAVAGATYTWTLPAGFTGTSTTNSINIVAGTAGGSVSVVAANGCGTSPAQTANITITTVAQPGAITGNAAVCEAGSATYTVPAVTGATSYNWTLPTGWTGSSTTNSITVTAGATGGTLSVAASNGTCTSTAQTMSVSVNPIPAIPTVTASGNTLSSSATTGNQWSFNGTPITGETGQFYTATASGFYTVTVTNTNGCSSTSTSFNHTMVGMEDAFAKSVSLKVYPNPASAEVTVFAGNADQELVVEINNVIGTQVLRSVAPSVNGKVEHKLNTTSLSQGVYLLTVKGKQGVYTTRLVIQ